MIMQYALTAEKLKISIINKHKILLNK